MLRYNLNNMKVMNPIIHAQIVIGEGIIDTPLEVDGVNTGRTLGVLDGASTCTDDDGATTGTGGNSVAFGPDAGVKAVALDASIMF